MEIHGRKKVFVGETHKNLYGIKKENTMKYNKNDLIKSELCSRMIRMNYIL